MDIAKQFGVEPVLLVAQIINFLIVLFLLKKLLYKPVLNMLKERKDSIKEGLDKAEEARLLLEKAKKEESEILQKAQAKSEKILESSKNQADEILRQSREQAKEEAELMITQAKESIEKETEKVKKEIVAHVGEISLALLKKALSESVNPKIQKEFLSQAAKNIKKKSN